MSRCWEVGRGVEGSVLLAQDALLQATVLFECKAQAEGGHLGAFLKDVRHNSLSVICMKCGVKRCVHRMSMVSGQLMACPLDSL